MLLQRIPHLPGRDLEQAGGFGLDPAAAFHGPYEAGAFAFGFVGGARFGGAAVG